MDKHSLDILIEKKINLVQGIEEYLDKLTIGVYERFELEKLHDGTYWIGMDFEVDLHDIKISSVAFYITIAEIYQSTFLMRSTPINEVVEKYISERMLDEIKFILNGPEDGEQVEGNR